MTDILNFQNGSNEIYSSETSNPDTEVTGKFCHFMALVTHFLYLVLLRGVSAMDSLY